MENCPICGKPVQSYYETEATKPFIHTIPFIGLEIWGSLQADKEVVCNNDQFVHFVFLHNNDNRLVKMGVEGSEASFYGAQASGSFFDDEDDYDESDSLSEFLEDVDESDGDHGL